MFEKRVKIFLVASGIFLLVCIIRLAEMQLLVGSTDPNRPTVHDKIEMLLKQGGSSQQFTTVRGKILDRKGRILACDEARFQLCMSYSLCSVLDPNVPRAALVRRKQLAEGNPANEDLEKAFENARVKLDEKRERVSALLGMFEQFGADAKKIRDRIEGVNRGLWRQRAFIAWWRNRPDSPIRSMPAGVKRFRLAMADFKKSFPSEESRLMLIGKVTGLPEMEEPVALFDLETEDDVFNAQVEFLGIEGVFILPSGKRYYPHGTAAAQTIGWVGPASQEEDLKLFAGDRLASYIINEDVCGREDGVEYVCESILRGRRGETIKDIDSQIVSETEAEFGKDVYLTLDIELQKSIEEYLQEHEHEPNCGPGFAAVVMDVNSGDVLALVSLPVFDLNKVREDYEDLTTHPKVNGRAYNPLINRALYQPYPPGSVVKPVIFIAAVESGAAPVDKVISCPAERAPAGWPSCWIWHSFRVGHDGQWASLGGTNNGRNAIKGSCNIYFSRLANMVEPLTLQQWLFTFGYGRSIVPPPACIKGGEFERSFRHSCGRISSGVVRKKVRLFGDVPPLSERERRWFGIGHGKFLATPMQVANAMATLAREGIYMNPQFFLDNRDDPESPMRISSGEMDVGMSPETLSVVFDGMSAVVNERNGTANRHFNRQERPNLDDFAAQDVRVWGKTGSTDPPNAWFAGFVSDSRGRSVALAVLVEGGESGASNAAPLGRDIIQLIINAGYVGQAIPIEEN